MNVLNALIGLAVGDALGVPVEFESREYLIENPITDMIGYKAHYQPLGTWSDDTSLALCLADSLCNGYNLYDISKKIISWYDNAIWTPNGKVFDIGDTTKKSIIKLKKILENNELENIIFNEFLERENGNGSLMRILPLVFFVKDMNIEEKFKYIREVSSLTHGHIRSCIACLIYICYASNLLKNEDKFIAYTDMQKEINNFLSIINTSSIEKDNFTRILQNDISKLPIEEIYSTTYVIHTLEASLWNILNHSDYETTVLSAVNMGDDSDTTASVTGGLAGIIYGIDKIPEKWVECLAKKDELFKLAETLNNSINTIY
ncbi:MAG: ADP-ribosylglycohydrolase family protein [Candidatus Sericytochromatia bacterium]